MAQTNWPGGVETQALTPRAFTTVCGGTYAHEIGNWLRTLRLWHPVEPVYIYADDAAAEWVERQPEHLRKNTWVSRVGEDHLAYARQQCVKVQWHNAYFKPEWIWLKLEALVRSVEHSQVPTLLADSDLIFTGRIDETWHAEAVLSPHWHMQNNDRTKQVGYFNAGWFLTASPRLARRWRSLYEQGVGGFYEQKCLEHLQAEFDCAYTSSVHNVGRWRQRPCPRGTKSIHGHIDDGDRHDMPHPYEEVMRSVLELAHHAGKVEPEKRVVIIHLPDELGGEASRKACDFVAAHRDVEVHNARDMQNADLQRLSVRQTDRLQLLHTDIDHFQRHTDWPGWRIIRLTCDPRDIPKREEEFPSYFYDIPEGAQALPLKHALLQSMCWHLWGIVPPCPPLLLEDRPKGEHRHAAWENVGIPPEFQMLPDHHPVVPDFQACGPVDPFVTP